MRHEKLPRAVARPITPRRLRAAENALRRERERHPLFADEVAANQPTPEERLAAVEANQVAHWQRIRDHAARTWRAARSILGSLPANEREKLLREWATAPYPPRAEYFADFLWRRTGRSASRETHGRPDAGDDA
ncbi:MAG: hypothetical protein KY475_06730 [Planctomycetes bacterium]|nr:hypothetical protein [Planctomycetota bacterium]